MSIPLWTWVRVPKIWGRWRLAPLVAAFAETWTTPKHVYSLDGLPFEFVGWLLVERYMSVRRGPKTLVPWSPAHKGGASWTLLKSFPSYSLVILRNLFAAGQNVWTSR